MRPPAWFVASAYVATTACHSPVTEGMLPQGSDDKGDEGDTDTSTGPGTPTTSTATSTATSTITSAGTTGATTEARETSTGDPSTTSETTAPPEGCGDGMLDPGEGCDLGYKNNHDGGSCTQSCQNAVCGDGLLWEGTEQCDNGNANNDLAYHGCREDCTPGPTCGDGVLQPDAEECDESTPPGEGQVADCTGCRFAARLAFITSASHPAKLGGLAGADALCVAAATAAGLDRASSFLAWLSDGVASPSQRFKNGIADKTTPYARRDGRFLANSFKALTAYGLQSTLDVDEFGATLPPKTYVWTATGPDGLPYNGEACGMWTLDSFKLKARVGLASPSLKEGALDMWKAGNHWTSFKFLPCSTLDIHLYCFED